jgi:hypothetical protein
MKETGGLCLTPSLPAGYGFTHDIIFKTKFCHYPLFADSNGCLRNLKITMAKCSFRKGGHCGKHTQNSRFVDPFEPDDTGRDYLFCE